MKRKIALETINVADVEEMLAGSPAYHWALAATLATVADDRACDGFRLSEEVLYRAAELARRMHEIDREMA
jgi:hypothetical protein